MKIVYLSLLLYIMWLATLISCQRWDAHQQTSNKQTARTGYMFYSEYGNNGITSQTIPPKSQQASSARGIGAWGYVAIILSIILTGMGVYYFTLFYPIVCKKERKYDVMEMTTV